MSFGFPSRLSLLAAFALALLPACHGTPELTREHLRRGDAALDDGHYAQALAAYGHARELSPTEPDVQRAMMRARVHLIAENAARLAPDAIEDARYEAAHLFDTDKPRAPVYLTALGNILAKLGDVEGAKVKYNEALAADPKSTLAHAALGLVSMRRKETASLAKAEFQKALETNPQNSVALVGWGQLELAEGDATNAVNHLEAALRIDDTVEAHLSLGSARVQQQKPSDAVPHFKRALELDPKNFDALSSLGQALLAAGRADEAEGALRAALQMRPDIGLSTQLGYALLKQKKSESALLVFRQVLADNPSSAPALFGAGASAEGVGKNEEALDLYKRLTLLPQSPADRQALGDLLREAEQRITALSPPPSASSSAKAGAPPAPPRATIENAFGQRH